MNTDSSNQQQEDRPAVIQFSDDKNAAMLQARQTNTMDKRLKRRESASSQAIIAYRTLSITVSESQAKGVNKSKKSKKSKEDVAEGNLLIHNYIQ